MIIHKLESQKNYELIDSGEEYKLERFGKYIISRPDPNVIWKKRLSQEEWDKSDAVFSKEKTGISHWKNKNIKDDWVFSFEEIKMKLQLSPFKHTGLFPEQISNWQWMGKILTNNSLLTTYDGDKEKNKKEDDKKPSILNLFGYTGGASLYCASKGAKITHVDASQPAINWAKENQKLSGLEKAPIRWILDDAIKFVRREVKRGIKYDGVIMDPPSFGRDQKGKVFKFEKNIPELLDLVKNVLVEKPLFVLINSYSIGYSPTTIKNILGDILPMEKIECGELQILEKEGKRALPCSVFARTKEIKN